MADARLHHHRLRNIWYGIVHRTTNPEHSRYEAYGGRGITLCDRWHSFDNFYDDMAEGYSIGLEVERVNNDSGYCKSNCRWATPKEQANNRRSSRFFTINGVTKTLAQWCDESSVKPSTIRQRLYGLGWSIEKALWHKKGI